MTTEPECGVKVEGYDQYCFVSVEARERLQVGQQVTIRGC